MTGRRRLEDDNFEFLSRYELLIGFACAIALAVMAEFAVANLVQVRPSPDMNDSYLWNHAWQNLPRDGVVVLGSSGACAGFEPTAIKKITKKPVTYLCSGLAHQTIILKAVAERGFRGTVLYNFEAEAIASEYAEKNVSSHLLKNAEQSDVTKRINDYILYHLNSRLRNRHVMTSVASWIRTLSATHALVNLRSLIVQDSRYQSYCRDGYTYNQADVTTTSEAFLWWVKHFFSKPAPIKDFMKRKNVFDTAASAIVGRGGQVIVAQLPVDKNFMRWHEQSFPAGKYWNRFATNNDIEYVDLHDRPELSWVKTCDGTHLTAAESRIVTEKVLRLAGYK